MTVDAARVGGSVTISARAYQRVAQAVLADELCVAPREVRARVRDDRGGLALELESAIPEGGAPVAIRAAQARQRTAERTTDLTGARIADVRLRVTHLIASEHRRLS